MNPVQELIDTEKAALKVLGKASLKNVGQEMIVSSDLSRQVDTMRIKATADAFAGATFQTIEQAEGEIDELITEISDINTLSEENVQSAFISHIDEHYGDMSTDAAINDMQAQAQEAVTQGAEDIKAWGIQNLETGLVQARAMTAEGKTMFDEWYQNFQTWSNDQIVSHTAHGAELNEKKNE